MFLIAGTGIRMVLLLLTIHQPVPRTDNVIHSQSCICYCISSLYCMLELRGNICDFVSFGTELPVPFTMDWIRIDHPVLTDFLFIARYAIGV